MTTHHQKRELLRLARSGHTRRLQQLLLSDVDVNFVNHKTGMTPLMTAAHAGQPACVELLLKHNADPNLRAADNASALHWASLKGDLRVVEMLIDSGADLNVRRESDGPAPIHMAIGNSHEEIAFALIDARASVDVKYLGDTVVEFAERHGCHAVASHLHLLGVRR